MEGLSQIHYFQKLSDCRDQIRIEISADKYISYINYHIALQHIECYYDRCVSCVISKMLKLKICTAAYIHGTKQFGNNTQNDSYRFIQNDTGDGVMVIESNKDELKCSWTD